MYFELFMSLSIVFLSFAMMYVLRTLRKMRNQLEESKAQ